MSRDWSRYTGEDKGYRSVKTEKQYVSEQTIIDVWRYLHENDYVLDDFVFSSFETGNLSSIKGVPCYQVFWADSFYTNSSGESVINPPFFNMYASADPRFTNAGWSGTVTYDEDGRVVYYAYWDTTGVWGHRSIRLTMGEALPVLNPYDNLPQNVHQNPALAAWKMVYENTPGSQMTDEEILVLLKSSTNIWKDYVTIGGKDYPYLPPLQ